MGLISSLAALTESSLEKHSMSASKPSPDTTRIDEQIQPYIEGDTSALHGARAGKLLRAASADTPLELLGEFALVHDICNTDVSSDGYYHRLKEENGYD